MIRLMITLTAVTAGLAGCTAAGGGAPPANAGAPEGGTAMTCDAGPAKSYVGTLADQAVGGAILKASGARMLRWGAPNSAWTMDYRQDRVNVRYDAAMTILDVTCG